MRVDLFSIGKFTVHSYGLLIAVGVVLAVIMAMRRAEKKDLSGEVALNMGIIAVIFGFLGAKILFVLESFEAFLEDPLSVLGSSGFVVYGGIIIGVVAIVLYCRIKRYSFFRYFDLLMPSVALGQAFGRLGCFCAGCCYGKETDLAWGVVFPEGSFAPAGGAAGSHAADLLRRRFRDHGHPAGIQQKSEESGRCGALYLLLYGIGRFSVEFLRQNEQGGFGSFTTAQLISFAAVAASVILFIRTAKAAMRRIIRKSFIPSGYKLLRILPDSRILILTVLKRGRGTLWRN